MDKHSSCFNEVIENNEEFEIVLVVISYIFDIILFIKLIFQIFFALLNNAFLSGENNGVKNDAYIIVKMEKVSNFSKYMS